MLGLFKGSPTASPPAPFTLLVIQADAYNWPELFEGVKVKGREVKVVQTGFDKISVGPAENYSPEKARRLCVHVHETTERDANGDKAGTKKRQTIFPDMLLVRNCVWTHAEDHKNTLYAFMYCNVPCVNSLESIYMSLERPVVMGMLNRIRTEQGREAFPVIDQAFTPGYREMMYPLGFPAVVKVGAAHAGFGKMRIKDHHDMHDFKSVLALSGGKYCSMEPFVEGARDLRIQCIGEDVKAFGRRDVSGEWKTNTGTSLCEQIEVTPVFRQWVEWVRPFFGGPSIFTIDAIEKPDGSHVILEVNDTSSGLFPDTAQEDNILIRGLVTRKMEEVL
eukprot:TRINITY_DN745_c0_g3_i1.p1 TRINITY_DN745_c0_g3~~TRINITY_DN745_c0_g3_i1.p1  ORF type:complete len:334 (+),score=123.32 TRINITY_DN745_c0_g3_i1:58-1059(+)